MPGPFDITKRDVLALIREGQSIPKVAAHYQVDAAEIRNRLRHWGYKVTDLRPPKNARKSEKKRADSKAPVWPKSRIPGLVANPKPRTKRERLKDELHGMTLQQVAFHIGGTVEQARDLIKKLSTEGE
ncbi:hypothetical protein ACFY2K_26085 [Kitasatospora sp. NPDC001309]|uniref:hypothetical protein n=1 Tax=Kitasatospora sp. NPDC001309 TaxID=3364013 RepID=UPI0036BA6012